MRLYNRGARLTGGVFCSGEGTGRVIGFDAPRSPPSVQLPTPPPNASFTFNPTTMSSAPELHIEFLFQVILINSGNYGIAQVIKTNITPIVLATVILAR
jgi:hypothetical protein